MECIQNTYVKNQDFYSKYITFHCKINFVKIAYFPISAYKVCESSDVRVNFKT